MNEKHHPDAHHRTSMSLEIGAGMLGCCDRAESAAEMIPVCMNFIYQDDTSTMKLAKNGNASSC